MIQTRDGTRIWTWGGQSMNQKNFKWHGLLKKKIMVGKTIAFYYHKYLSQEGNNMNKKSWKLQYDILTFSKKKNKKRKELRIFRFWVIGIKMLILSRWPTHQYDKPILLDATKTHTNEVFKTLFEDFKKNWDINIKSWQCYIINIGF